MQKSELTLRERRRQRTWNAIHEAAVSLVKEKGLRQTTTDEIAEHAGISPRTFFNYFASKEDAVLGLREPQITPEMIEADRLRQDSYIFERVVHLLLDIVLSSISPESYARYCELGSENPVFRDRFKVSLLKCERVLEDFLHTVDWKEFAARGRRGKLVYLEEGAELTEEHKQKVRASVAICTAILRYMVRANGLPQKAEREKKVRESVEVFQHLLRAD